MENEKKIKALSNELYRKIQGNLEKAMHVEKLYLEQDLNMHELAKKIETNTSYLSHTIKSLYCTNFSSFINRLRIDEAKRIIANPRYDNYTIDAIAQKSGYKSKSTFYKAFEDITQLSPNEYRKKIKVDSRKT